MGQPDRENHMSTDEIEEVPLAKTSLLKSSLAGGFGGACLVFVGHPLDTIKVRLQTMPIIEGQKPMYSGTLDCALQTVRKEGFFALYKGMLAPLTGVTPMYSLCFLGYEIGKNIFTEEKDYKELNLVRIGAAGATSGLFTTPILAPLERAKCLLQIQNNSGNAKFKGPFDVYRHLWKESSSPIAAVQSINKGFFATMLRESVASFFYFSTYEWLKFKLRREGERTPGVLGTLFAGGMAGIFNWLGCIPIDTMKSKLQTAPEGTYPHGIRSVFTSLIREHGAIGGVRSMYRGIGAIMLRAFPANAAAFYGYETAIVFLNYLGVP